MVSLMLLLLIYLTILNPKKDDCIDLDKEEYKGENINEKIDKAINNYMKDLSKYNIGSKSYDYEFIPNEQPLNGLNPDFSQNYQSTLKKSNKMLVDPDLTINYTNLLNTSNNSLKNYYNNVNM
jgi:hypothetical protein